MREKSDATINVRVSESWRDLIDRAASASGKNRTEFIVESARRQAVDILLDQCFFTLDGEHYAAFAKALDNPAQPNKRLKRLMASKAPWEKH